MANEELKALRKAATKGRGKDAKERNNLWIDAFTQVIQTNPAASVVVEAGNRPRIEPREPNKRTGWMFEVMINGTWQFSTVLNFDKEKGQGQPDRIRFTHTLRWCMSKLKKEADLFKKGTYDKCLARVRNVVTGQFVMVAILV
jgi:hypothetical protein